MRARETTGGARGGAITLIGQFVKIGINAVSIIAFSHLLSPADIGLVAMVTVLITFGEMLRDSGLSTSSLRAPKLSSSQASNLFWMNVALGTLAAFLVALSTPLVVWFYEEPRLAAITPVLALTLIFSGLQAQVQVQMARRQMFTGLALTDVLSRLVGLVVGVGAAMAGASYWALVWQSLSQGLFLVLARWLVSGWRPERPRRGVGTAPLFLSGLDFTGASLLAMIANNLDVFIIGRRFGAAPLGMYNRATQLLTVPLGQVMGPLTSVIVPLLNRAKLEGRGITEVLLRTQSILATFSIWLLSALVVSADNLLPLVLGPEWDGVAPLFMILAAGGVGSVLYQIVWWAFLVEIPSRQLLVFQTFYKSLSALIILSGGMGNLSTTAAAVALANVLGWPLGLYWLHKRASFNSRVLFLHGIRIITSGLIATAGAWALPLDSLVTHPVTLVLLQLIASLVLNVVITAATRGGRKDLASILQAVRSATTR